MSLTRVLEAALGDSGAVITDEEWMELLLWCASRLGAQDPDRIRRFIERRVRYSQDEAQRVLRRAMRRMERGGEASRARERRR